MNSDEQFKEKIRKSVIIELYNMNVIPKLILKVLETPEKSTSLAFFFEIHYKEIHKERTKKLSFKYFVLIFSKS